MAKQRKLSELLKIAKTKPMKFVLVAKGAGTTRLLMNEGRIAPKSIEDAMKEINGRVVARGVCKSEGNDLAFECAQDPPGSLETQLKLAIKTEGKMSVNVVTRKSGVAIPEDEEGEDQDEQDVETGEAISRMFSDETPAPTDGKKTPESPDDKKKAPEPFVLEKKRKEQRGRPKPMTNAERKAAAEKAADEKRRRAVIEVLIDAGKDMKEKLKGKMPQPGFDELKALDKAARQALQDKLTDKAEDHAKDLMEKVHVAKLGATDPAKAKKEMTEELDDSRKRLKDLKGKIAPFVWKKLDADAAAVEKLIADAKWKEAWDAQTKLFSAVVRVGRVKPKAEHIQEDKRDDEETKKWKKEQREIHKERDRVTGKVKALSARVAKLTDPRTAPLKKVTAAMVRGLKMRDFSRIEPAANKVEDLVDKAEELQKKKEAAGEGGDAKSKLEENRQQKAKYTAEIQALAKRAVQLPREGNKPLRQGMTDLFKLVNTRKWDELKTSVADMTAKITDAEKLVKA